MHQASRSSASAAGIAIGDDGRMQPLLTLLLSYFPRREGLKETWVEMKRTA